MLWCELASLRSPVKTRRRNVITKTCEIVFADQSVNLCACFNILIYNGFHTFQANPVIRAATDRAGARERTIARNVSSPTTIHFITVVAQIFRCKYCTLRRRRFRFVAELLRCSIGLFVYHEREACSRHWFNLCLYFSTFELYTYVYRAIQVSFRYIYSSVLLDIIISCGRATLVKVEYAWMASKRTR